MATENSRRRRKFTNTARLLGSFGSTTFWVAEDNAGNICLLSNDDVRVMTAGSCGTPGELRSSGISMAAAVGESDGFEAYLNPDGYTLAPDSSYWTVVSENLIVMPFAGEGPREAVLSDANGNTISVERLSGLRE